MDAAENIYVSSINTDSVHIFNSSGNQISRFGGSGTGNGQFDRSEGMAFDASGAIYVVDEFNDRIQKFTGSVLPIELTSLKANVADKTIILNWTTQSETNNAGFEIQHRQNKGFAPIGFVAGRGTTATPQHYAYTVSNLPTGTHYFRLKQVDFNRGFAFSQIVTTLVELPANDIALSVYPNPFQQSTTLSVMVERAQTVSINLVDVLGRPVQSVYHGLLAVGASYDFQLGGFDLPNGVYLVQVQGESFQRVEQIIRW